jgi:hypothetical protein
MIITTTKGDMDESLLVKTEGVVDNENERTAWVEYRLPGSDEIIHRSAHVTLKEGMSLLGEIQNIG